MSKPAAVIGIVAFVIVTSIYLSTCEVTRLHVGNESIGISPTFANRDASTAIVSEPAVLRVIASISHRKPFSVKNGVGQPVFGYSLDLTAATASDLVSFKHVNSDDVRECSADTSANSNVAVSAWSLGCAGDRERAKDLAWCDDFRVKRNESDFTEIHISLYPATVTG